MARITLRLPDVKRQVTDRPRGCRYCGGRVLQRWGRVPKPIRDPQHRQVEAQRYRCTACERTFRHYPEGVSQADQSERLVQLAALMWVLGLSLRGVEAVLGAFGVRLGRTTVWRDAQALAQEVKARRLGRRVRVLGVDGAWVKLGGRQAGVMVAVDLGTGEPVAIGLIDESEVGAVARWLRELVGRLGVDVLVTDDLASYRGVAAELGLGHQICAFHMRRWVGRSLRSAAKRLGPRWEAELDQVQQIVADLPADGDQQLFELWEHIPERHPGRGGKASALYRFKQVLLRLSQAWGSYRLFREQEAVPSTNNGTEQVIGRLKIRSRTVRGYKSLAGLEAMFQLCGAPAS